MKIKLSLSALLLVVLNIHNLRAQITLPAIFGDNMVLQQRENVALWGWGSPHEEIEINTGWSGKTYKTTADKDGKWETRLKTGKAGGPYELKIAGKESITLSNIMLGEVWLCSGQSNMEMPMNGFPNQPVKNAKAEINAANYPNIRLFTVNRKTSLNQEKNVSGTWKSATPQTVAEFSATAYFFGINLYKALGVPIGLIHSSWGGTVAEAWTSEESLRKMGDFDDALDHQDSLAPMVEKIRREDLKKQEKWAITVDHPIENYQAQDTDFSQWKTMPVPANWDTQGYADFDGVAWFKRNIDIPESWKGRALTLELGPIDDVDITWFNGEKIGETNQDGPVWQIERKYSVPATLVQEGKNTLTVRVVDLRSGGGIYGKKDQLKIYPENNVKDTIYLDGRWNYKMGAEAPQLQLPDDPNRPGVLFNAMIAPLIPYTLRGAIWYQGESNVGRADQYATLFPTMIKDWRSQWNQGDFPFYYVEIAPFTYNGDGREAARLRDAQRHSLQTKNTGMAVLMDIGSLQTIHPPNKEEVGRRLALQALTKTYGRKLTADGPKPAKKVVKGDRVTLYFDHAKELKLTGDTSNSFELAGEDGEYFPAKVEKHKDYLILHAPEVNKPVSVRYAFKDTSQGVLFNEAGLPASSFQLNF